MSTFPTVLPEPSPSELPDRTRNDFGDYFPDDDPTETQDWVDSFDALVREKGSERAHYLIGKLLRRAQGKRVQLPALVQTPYVNTIPFEREPAYPGDEKLEKRIRRVIRWNAVAMVVRANHRFAGIGGHLSTYASAATLYEVGFNHFFHGRDAEGGGDLVYFQGHASPGIYARAFVEGRLTRDQMEFYRRETEHGRGLSSYPHPWLMPDFWEYPTVSMGLGPLAAIYQARFNRYLHARGIKDTSKQRVWAFLGDGETDEPESLGSLSIAAREGLDNLVFVVNCNLQRLDGPVRGNGKIIQELEAVFHGAGWNVLKVVWGSEWDPLLAQDTDGALVRRMGEVVDGQYQRYSVDGGDYTRQHFFGADPRLERLVANLTDDDIRRLRRGGHDARKVYAAYLSATQHKGAPTAILAKTVKGWTLGEGAEGKNVTHQQKKLSERELRQFRDLLELPIGDDALAEEPPFYLPDPKSPEMQYLRERRHALGGSVPRRVVKKHPLVVPPIEAFEDLLKGGGRAISTTTSFVRMLDTLLRDANIGQRVVPVIPDEARTFGVDAFFRERGIYSALGQLYEPVDAKTLMFYREAKTGQILEEGITEAGAMASFTAAGTSYATHGEPMIPFYMFYSMFGFQRTGDQAWAFGDSRGRGFMLGCTAGRTTLSGEGLQHCDGQSQLLASAVPTCVPWDPAWGYEIALIVQDGLRRMYVDQEDTFYYVTLHNEAYDMPAMPAGCADGVLRGLYRYRAPLGAPGQPGREAELLGSGAILRDVLKAQEILQSQYGVAASVWSATSYTKLRREALAAERWNRLHPESEPRTSWVEQQLAAARGPVVAASDWMKLVPEQIARWVPGGLTALGTDGFGRSDVRESLRTHFEIDAPAIVVGTLDALARRGVVPRSEVAAAITALGIDPERIDPARA